MRRGDASGAAELAAARLDGFLTYADFTATPAEIIERQHINSAPIGRRLPALSDGASPKPRRRPGTAAAIGAHIFAAQSSDAVAAALRALAPAPPSAQSPPPQLPAQPHQRAAPMSPAPGPTSPAAGHAAGLAPGTGSPPWSPIGAASPRRWPSVWVDLTVAERDQILAKPRPTPFHRRVWYTPDTVERMHLENIPEALVVRTPRVPDGCYEQPDGVYHLLASSTTGPVMYNGHPVWMRVEEARERGAPRPAGKFLVYSRRPKDTEKGEPVWAVGECPDTPPFRHPKSITVECKRRGETLGDAVGVAFAGTRVSNVWPGAPAYERGVRVDHVVVSLGRTQIATTEDIATAFKKLQAEAKDELLQCKFREALTPEQPLKVFIECAVPHRGVLPHLISPIELPKETGGKKKDGKKKSKDNSPPVRYLWRLRHKVPILDETGESAGLPEWEWAPEPLVSVLTVGADRKARRARFGRRVQAELSPCLTVVHRALLGELSEPYRSIWEFRKHEDDSCWEISLEQYAAALSSLSVDDDPVARKLEFAALARTDERSCPKTMPYRQLLDELGRLVRNEDVIMAAFRRFASLSGPQWEAGRRQEVGRLNRGPVYCKYDAADQIHKERLLEMRGPRLSGVLKNAAKEAASGSGIVERTEADGLPVTPAMVKTLLDIFTGLKEAEVNDFLDRMDGKKKKKKKKKKKGGPSMPPHMLHYKMAGNRLQGVHPYHRNRHINFACFRSHMLENPEAVRSFLPLYLGLLANDPALLGRA
eukprot:TRINITY_DN7466_c0_g1_i3.p1 TRINITY_DN7466_c0_g1~~TRINITY_DN7466_c0_g1_i3.p1  ORF type:complete len:791 (+),score=196.58 TRINITY_DN7466_c0_g1_i3:84-2375(+)